MGSLALVVPGQPGDAEAGNQDHQRQQDLPYPVHGCAWKSTIVAASEDEKYFSKMRRTVPSARISCTSARHFSRSAADKPLLDMISPCGTDGSLNSMIAVTSRICFSSTTG